MVTESAYRIPAASRCACSINGNVSSIDLQRILLRVVFGEKTDRPTCGRIHVQVGDDGRILLGHAVRDLANGLDVVDAKRVGAAERRNHERHARSIAIEFVERLFEQIQPHGTGMIGRHRVQVGGAHAEPAGQRGIGIVGSFRDHSHDVMMAESIPHRLRHNLLDTQLAAVEIRDRASHRKHTPGRIGVVEDEVRQSRDRLDLQFVGAQAIGVDAEIRILEQAGQRSDERGEVRRAFDVFQVQFRVPAIGAPEKRKDRVAGVLEVARQCVDLGIRLGRLVVARHQAARRQRGFRLHRGQQFVENLRNLPTVAHEKGFHKMVQLSSVHGAFFPRFEIET